LDELWSFVHDKKNQCWIWIALCAVTKQVVAFAAGDRGTRTCRALLREIPWRYKQAKCYGDFWEAYQAIILSDQHEAVGKDSGKTNHVERWNRGEIRVKTENLHNKYIPGIVTAYLL
jgi:insertion element IS1 protein InsB